MKFTLTPTGQLGRFLALICALILMLPPGEAQKRSRHWKDAVCNENCKSAKAACDHGRTCNKISHPARGYDCFECTECINMRKHNETLKPGEVYKLKEECVRVKVTCLACPDCAKLIRMALTSSREASPENAELLGSHDFFGVWGALGVSVVVNLLLLNILANKCSRRNKKTLKTKRDEAHEAMMDGVEMQQVERF